MPGSINSQQPFCSESFHFIPIHISKLAMCLLHHGKSALFPAASGQSQSQPITGTGMGRGSHTGTVGKNNFHITKCRRCGVGTHLQPIFCPVPAPGSHIPFSHPSGHFFLFIQIERGGISLSQIHKERRTGTVSSTQCHTVFPGSHPDYFRINLQGFFGQGQCRI